MDSFDPTISPPARVADPDEGISAQELSLAARNHGLPLELLRHDVTPIGAHYLLTHYDIPAIEPASWCLQVTGATGAAGAIEKPLELDLAAIQALPAVTRRVTIECAGNGRARLVPRPVSQPWLDEAVGTAQWTGTPLAALLAEAGISSNAVDVAFTGADHGVERGVEQDYARGLSVSEALTAGALLVYAMNDQPLPAQHGGPLRLVVPGWYGMAQVKWLRRITVLTEPFDGFQNVRAYRIKTETDDDGEPVTRIRPRALVVPPGFPDFMSRKRIVDRGRIDLFGRAWSGWAPIERVEVSVDGGASWHDAELGPQPEPYCWRSWSWTWQAAAPGHYELCARARDDAGNVQPVSQSWNRQGMANNHVQRVSVLVR